MRAIDRCRGCSGKGIEPFFDLGMQPLANALARDRAARDPVHPLSLSWCPDCGLVQLNHTADPGELFSEYVWLTASSSTAKAYAERFCDRVLDLAGDAVRGGYVLEAASNDGTFLKPFQARGLRVLGVDPAKNIADLAVADGVPTENAFFGRKSAERIVSEHGLPAVVFARNVLPHVADPHDFVEGLRLCAGERGLAIIEVHYAKAILDELHYDSIYHEHLCYFTLKSLERLLEAHGLFAFEAMISPISGGSVVLFARGVRAEKGPVLAGLESAERAEAVNDLARWREFADKSLRHRELFVGLLEQEAEAGRRVVGYGASARSSTMLNFCGLGPDRIAAVADQNRLKQGFFTPGTHIPILAPEQVMAQGPDTVVVLAWNFMDEIGDLLWDRFGFRGGIIAPLPFPPRKTDIREVRGG
ncbi:MAG: class I SAM-dependent methyltransferase [Desulfovibrionaceae bacterium]|nr:class I SAM-dependent methyltransferase [Desulfovibrionaceae bacterium]